LRIIAFGIETRQNRNIDPSLEGAKVTAGQTDRQRAEINE